MIKCKNCVNFKEHYENDYECLKIYNMVINDKDFEHECQLFTKPTPSLTGEEL